jgi:hypothetical protein
MACDDQRHRPSVALSTAQVLSLLVALGFFLAALVGMQRARQVQAAQDTCTWRLYYHEQAIAAIAIGTGTSGDAKLTPVSATASPRSPGSQPTSDDGSAHALIRALRAEITQDQAQIAGYHRRALAACCCSVIGLAVFIAQKFFTPARADPYQRKPPGRSAYRSEL